MTFTNLELIDIRYALELSIEEKTKHKMLFEEDDAMTLVLTDQIRDYETILNRIKQK